jgi:hypothetical protein
MDDQINIALKISILSDTLFGIAKNTIYSMDAGGVYSWT